VEGVSNIVQVASIKTGNRDSSIHSHVDMMFFSQLIYLVLVKTGVGKHTNLAGNVAPVVFVSEGFEFSSETGSHLLHSAGHEEELVMPFSGQGWVTEDNIDNSGSMDWWIRVHWSSNLFHS